MNDHSKQKTSSILHAPIVISKNYLIKKYTSFQYSFSLLCINNLISKEKCEIVAKFKDFLIYDDATEFLNTFVPLNDIYPKLKQIVNFYNCYSRIFPNYIILPENDFIYKNIRKKQKLINNLNSINNNVKNTNLIKQSTIQQNLFFNSIVQRFIEASNTNIDNIFQIYISSIKKTNDENEKNKSFLCEKKCLFEESESSLKIIISNFGEYKTKKYLKKSLSTQNSRNFLPRKSNLYKILESNNNNNHILTYANKKYNYNEHLYNKNYFRLIKQNKYLLTKENITSTFSTNCTNTGITSEKLKSNKNINSYNLTKLVKNKRNNLKIDVSSETAKISVNTRLKTITNFNNKSIFHKNVHTVLSSANKSLNKKLLNTPVITCPLKNKLEKRKINISKKGNNFIRNNKCNFKLFKTFTNIQKNINSKKQKIEDFNKISEINKLKEKYFNIYLNKKQKIPNAYNNKVKNLKGQNTKKNTNVLLVKIEKANLTNKIKFTNGLKNLNRGAKVNENLHMKNKSAMNKNNLSTKKILLFKNNYICK